MMFDIRIYCEVITTIKLINISVISHYFCVCGENTKDLPS